MARGVDRTHTGAVSNSCSSGASGGSSSGGGGGGSDGGGGGGSSGASRSVFTQGEVPLARATRRSRTSPSALPLPLFASPRDRFATQGAAMRNDVYL